MAVSTCIVSGTLTDPSGTAISGATVLFNIDQPVLDASNTYLLGPEQLSTTTATNGTWSLTIAQGASGTLTIKVPQSSSDSTAVYTFGLQIPSTATATFSAAWADSPTQGSYTPPFSFTLISGQLTTAQMPTLPSTDIWVGNGSNVAAPVALSGDASLSNAGALTVNTVGASTASNIHAAELLANAATNANTASTIVKRDASGNFSAGTVSASLTGTASGNTTYSANNHGVVLSSASNAMTVVAPDASTSKVLVSGGSSADPAWFLLTNSNLSGSAGITNANLSSVSTATFKGRTTAGSGAPEDLTATQATALLNALVGDSGSGGTKGLAPAPSAGDAAAGKVLKADGTWGSAGTTSPLTTKGDLYTYSTTNARLPVGVNGQTLIADSNQTLGVRYQDQAPKNYILNSDAEVGVEGWSTYADAAQNTPVDATGGSPSSTWTRTTSSPLRGTGSFLWTRSAANRQGEGVAYAFSIDSADQARVLSISFDYKVVSGTLFAADGITAPLNDGTTSQNTGMSDLEVFVYDVTNSALIPVSPQVLTSTSAISAPFKGTFQTASNSTSYRLILHTARSTAVAFTAQFDNFLVSPQISTLGPPLTDWQSYTPTFGAGFGTVTSIDFWYRRIGDSYQVSGKAVTGTAAASAATISLPNSATIDGTKVAGTRVAGIAVRNLNATYNEAYVLAVSGGPSTVSIGGYIEGGTASGLTPLTAQNGSAIFGNSETFTVDFLVPVAGFSSNVVMSNDTDTRVVDLFVRKNATQSVTANSTNISFTVTPARDSHGAWNGTDTYTIPVSGDYVVSAALGNNATTQDGITVYVNGSAQSMRLLSTPSGVFASGINIVTGLKAGDTITLRDDTTTTLAAIGHLGIHKLSGPASVAATESVNARYYASATSISGSLATVIWTTKDFDSHNSMSAGTYTIVTSGKYQVNTALALAGTFALNNQSNLVIQKNGVTVSELLDYAAGAETADHVFLSDIISCVAGDTIRVQVSSGATSPSIVSSNTKNYFSISRVGN